MIFVAVSAAAITATKEYVDKATNAVHVSTIAAVTNEIQDGWVCTPAEWQGKPIEIRLAEDFEPNVVDGRGVYRPYVGDESIGMPMDIKYPPAIGAKLDFGHNWYGVEPLIAVYTKGGGNSLGLATAKDLDGRPTYEAATNIARAVVNTVWDEKLGVAWEARMHDGALYYIAVTNRPPEMVE
jgi:hypothetical protein